MRPTLAFSALLAAVGLAASASAQVQAMDYAHHWAPNAETVDVLLSGPALFTPSGAPTQYAGAIRRCYGVDTTQGGTNEAAGIIFVPNMRIVQAFGPASTSIDIGLVSVQSASSSDLNGDICFSPFGPTSAAGAHVIHGSAVLGALPYTMGAPLPTVWDVAFQWLGTTGVFLGVYGASTNGVDPTSGTPLLVNLIYEVQAPIDAGPSNNQYFAASTNEVTGRGTANGTVGLGFGGGTGGVTNGNSDFGSALFGVSAEASGATAHSRVLGGVPPGPLMLSTTLFPALDPLTPVELSSFVGFQAATLWATNDVGQPIGPNEGAGGPDWRIGQEPVSVVDLLYVDHLCGAQSVAGGFFKAGVPLPPTVAATSLGTAAVNFPIFVWSATPAASMPQLPLSWDDLSGTVPPQAGSIALGTFATLYGGSGVATGGGPSSMRVAANLDALMLAFLGNAGFSAGRTLLGSDDIFLDGPLYSSFFEGALPNNYPGTTSPKNLISGSSGLPSGATSLGAANALAVGRRIGVHAAGVQLDPNGIPVLTEFTNALTIVLQP